MTSTDRQRKIHRLQDRLRRYFQDARRKDGTYNFLRIRSLRKYETHERAVAVVCELEQTLEALMAEEQEARGDFEGLDAMEQWLRARLQARFAERQL